MQNKRRWRITKVRSDCTPAKSADPQANPSALHVCASGLENASIEIMELALRVQVEELPEGLFLATSEEMAGLVAQGRTVAEALEIACDVARKLIEARRDREGPAPLPVGGDFLRA